VKIEHTVFALPFAYIGALLCVRRIPSAHDLVWITFAMVGARSLAMGLNRVIDAEIDARNPRTADRELPAGRLSRANVTVFCALALALYLVSCFQLDPIVRWLWPIPLAGFAGRRVGRDHRSAALGGVGARRCGRSLDRGLRRVLFAVRP
jgi:4-hydroxybenzoate polyprenyltransferase